MRYKQYKFKFYLNARHAIYHEGELGEVHPHTWEFVLFVVKARHEFTQFHIIENKIEQCLDEYQDKYINEIAPFDVVNPTLENVADYFKDRFSELLNKEGWLLIMMEMSETPSRTYVITLLDDIELSESQTLNTFTDTFLERVRGNDKNGN